MEERPVIWTWRRMMDKTKVLWERGNKYAVIHIVNNVVKNVFLFASYTEAVSCKNDYARQILINHKIRGTRSEKHFLDRYCIEKLTASQVETILIFSGVFESESIRIELVTPMDTWETKWMDI